MKKLALKKKKKPWPGEGSFSVFAHLGPWAGWLKFGFPGRQAKEGLPGWHWTFYALKIRRILFLKNTILHVRHTVNFQADLQAGQELHATIWFNGKAF